MTTLADWAARPSVALAMCAAGAIAGIAVAGVSLFSTRGPSTWAVPLEDAATVNGRPILMSDYTTQVEMELGVPFMKATPAQRQQVLDEMIREELFVERGLELNEPAVDSGTRTALVLSVQQQIAVDAAAEQPSEAKLRAFYQAHRDKYEEVGEMLLHDLVPAPGRAPNMAAAAASLKAGQPMGRIMEREGLKESGKLFGSEFYFGAAIHLGPRLFKIASALADGQSTGPVMDGGVPHILVMEHNKRPVPESFEDAHDAVYADYREAAAQALRDSEYRFLRTRSDIRIAPQTRASP